MWKRICVLTLALSLSSCTALDIAKEGAKAALGTQYPSIDAKLNAGNGEAEGDQSVAQNASTAVSGQVNDTESYEGPVGQVVNEAGFKLHELLLLVLLAGWAIPSPSEMILGIARTIRNSIFILRKQPPP